jgi:hypothetical protein
MSIRSSRAFRPGSRGDFGQNKEIVSVFNGSVVYFNVGIGLTFLGRSCSTREELYFQLFFKK